MPRLTVGLPKLVQSKPMTAAHMRFAYEHLGPRFDSERARARFWIVVKSCKCIIVQSEKNY